MEGVASRRLFKPATKLRLLYLLIVRINSGVKVLKTSELVVGSFQSSSQKSESSGDTAVVAREFKLSRKRSREADEPIK